MNIFYVIIDLCKKWKNAFNHPDIYIVYKSTYMRYQKHGSVCMMEMLYIYIYIFMIEMYMYIYNGNAIS